MFASYVSFTVVGHDQRGGGFVIDEEHGVRQDEVLQVRAVGAYGDDGRGWAAGMVQIADVFVERAHLADGLLKAFAERQPRISTGDGEELGAEPAGEPGDAMPTTGVRSPRSTRAIEE